MSDALRPLPPLLLLGAIWGATPVMVKHLAAHGWPPLLIGTCAAAGSAVILLGRVLDARAWRCRCRARICATTRCRGCSALALANVVGFTSLRHVPAGFFSLLVPLSPILTVLAAAALGFERVTLRRVLGTVLGLAGVLLAMAPAAALPDPAMLPWALLAALTPACYAASNLLAVRLAPCGTPPLALAAGTLSAGTITLAAFALMAGQLTHAAARRPAGLGPAGGADRRRLHAVFPIARRLWRRGHVADRLHRDAHRPRLGLRCCSARGRDG